MAGSCKSSSRWYVCYAASAGVRSCLPLNAGLAPLLLPAFHCPHSSAQEGALDYYATGDKENSLIFDTTSKVSVYDVTLGCFAAIGKEGETRILAATILLREDTQSFVWAFDAFRETFKIPPEALITDGDPGMRTAIELVFPESLHILCIYHLSLNFVTHVKPAFGNDTDGFKAALNGYWRIAKQTDLGSLDTFDYDFEQTLVAPLQVRLEMDDLPDATVAKIQSALSWLESLRERAEHWAYRFTWSFLTLGANASQVSLMLLWCLCARGHAGVNVTPPESHALSVRPPTPTCCCAALRVDPLCNQACGLEQVPAHRVGRVPRQVPAAQGPALGEGQNRPHSLQHLQAEHEPGCGQGPRGDQAAGHHWLRVEHTAVAGRARRRVPGREGDTAKLL